MNILHAWMSAQRDLLPEGSAISRALDYSLKRWAALSRYIDDGAVGVVSIRVAIASLYELNSRRVTGSTMTIQTPHDTGDQKRNRRNFM